MAYITYITIHTGQIEEHGAIGENCSYCRPRVTVIGQLRLESERRDEEDSTEAVIEQEPVS